MKNYFTSSLLFAFIMMGAVFQAHAVDSKPSTSLLTPVEMPNKTKESKYPGEYQRSGRVSTQDGSERSIVISGKKYYYGINTKVHTPQSDFSSIQTLVKGTNVGINYTEDANGRRLLYEVWVLPPELPGTPSLIDN